MESWNHIVQVALLGTGKAAINKEALAMDLADRFDQITALAPNKEEAFLQIASLIYNFRQCGFVPVHKATLPLPVADPEDKGYASPLAHQLLADIIEWANPSLLQLWLERCSARNKIIQPEWIPLLLDTGVKVKQLRPLIQRCCGKRGQWLAQFQTGWQFGAETDEATLWDTGTLEERKTILATIRASEPARGRTLLQEVWNQENAATKAELLEPLIQKAGNEDVPWLETLLNEKSSKVKEAALKILKAIPSSSIVQAYWQILQRSVEIKTSKGLLGIGASLSLEIKLAAVDESIFKTGIQPLSGQAHISDDHFILYQLIGAVPPHLWEDHFRMDKKAILQLFMKEKEHRSFVHAVGLAAARFVDKDWLRAVIAIDDNALHLDAFSLLPQKEAEAYALRFLQNDEGAASVVHVIHYFKEEWSLDFASAVLRFIAKNPYQYNKSFYNQIGHLLPLPIAEELEHYLPGEAHLQAMWSNLSAHLLQLLTLKRRISTSFNE